MLPVAAILDSTDIHGLPRWHSGKESSCQCKRHGRHRFNPWVEKIPWRRWLSFPGSSVSKESACSAGDPGLTPGSRGRKWRRKWQSTPVSLPGKSHGQRSLVSCSPWVTELDTTEWLHFYTFYVLWRKIHLLRYRHKAQTSKAVTGVSMWPNPGQQDMGGSPGSFREVSFHS